MRSFGRYALNAPNPCPQWLTHTFVVFRTREPPRRVHRLCIRRIIVSIVPFATPLLLPPYIDDATVAFTHLDTTRGVRARVPNDGREWRSAPGVLQGDGATLHIR